MTEKYSQYQRIRNLIEAQHNTSETIYVSRGSSPLLSFTILLMLILFGPIILYMWSTS